MSLWCILLIILNNNINCFQKNLATKLFKGCLFATESWRYQAVTAVSADKGTSEKCSLTAKMGLTFSSSKDYEFMKTVMKYNLNLELQWELWAVCDYAHLLYCSNNMTNSPPLSIKMSKRSSICWLVAVGICGPTKNKMAFQFKESTEERSNKRWSEMIN